MKTKKDATKIAVKKLPGCLSGDSAIYPNHYVDLGFSDADYEEIEKRVSEVIDRLANGDLIDEHAVPSVLKAIEEAEYKSALETLNARYAEAKRVTQGAMRTCIQERNRLLAESEASPQQLEATGSERLNVLGGSSELWQKERAA